MAPHSALPAGAVLPRLKLGLIGDHILESRSPDLHRQCGRLAGFDVSYELLIPPQIGKSFEAVFEDCARNGFRGVNVTYPYKERVTAHVAVENPFIQALGSVNTVVFEPGGALGYNTDYSGFIAAYRNEFAAMAPGVTVVVGAGGVGRAIAFALATLGAAGIRVVDTDPAKARSVSQALKTAFGAALAVETASDVSAAVEGAGGIVNCTPLGMSDHPGSAVPSHLLAGSAWAFDAVYTPRDTRFKLDCEQAGLRFLGGYELFFHQGVEAFSIFSGSTDFDHALLRQSLVDSAA